MSLVLDLIMSSRPSQPKNGGLGTILGPFFRFCLVQTGFKTFQAYTGVKMARKIYYFSMKYQVLGTKMFRLLALSKPAY